MLTYVDTYVQSLITACLFIQTPKRFDVGLPDDIRIIRPTNTF